jgi:hypothetical protein
MKTSNTWLPRDAVLVLVLTAVVVAGFSFLPRERIRELMREDGWVQHLSVIMLALGALYCARRGWQAGRTGGDWWTATVVFAGLGMRELDFQKRFTPKAFDNIMFFKNPNIALTVKIVVVLAVLPFALALGRLVWLALRDLPNAVRQRRPWLAYAVGAAGLLVIALNAEKACWWHVEEIGELALAVLLVLLARSVAAQPAGTGPNHE